MIMCVSRHPPPPPPTPIFTGSRRRLSLPLLSWAAHGVSVFVEPQEIQLYRDAHPGVRFLELPKNDGGFSYLMNQMCRRTLSEGGRYFFFTDDDVTALKSRAAITEKFKNINPQDLSQIVWSLERMAVSEDLSQVAVSFAGQSWAASKPSNFCIGAWGVHLTDARAVMDVGGYDESLVCFGDWDLSARLILSGHKTARTNLITFVHKMKSHEGGAEDVYRRKDLVRDSAHRCASKFPEGCARVVYVESHGLHEVRFNWKKLRLSFESMVAGSHGS